MARATYVKKARKDNEVVKKGEPYWWWKFRFGGKHYSVTKPRASQLTQSEFLGRVYDIDDRIGEIDSSMSIEDMQSVAMEIAEEYREISGECQEKLDNMPEQLQYAPTGELLQERIDGCEEAADSMESVDFDVSVEEDEGIEDQDERESQYKDEMDEAMQGIVSSMQDAAYGW